MRDSIKNSGSNGNLSNLYSSTEKKKIKEDEKSTLLTTPASAFHKRSSLFISLKLKYGLLYHLFAWGIPLLSSILVCKI